MMNRTKGSPHPTAKQEQSNANRTSSSASLPSAGSGKHAKQTESNYANNNINQEALQNPSTTSESGPTCNTKGKTAAPPCLKSNITAFSEVSKPSNPKSALANDDRENKTNNNKNVQGQQQTNQQKTISFSEPPATSSSISIKSAGGMSRSKPAIANNRNSQQQQPQNQLKGNANSNNNNVSTSKSQDLVKSSTPPTVQPTMNQVKSGAKSYPEPVTQQRYPGIVSRSMVSLERSRNFRAFIEKAINEHKIFSCCGVYPAIRNALKKRGWVEKPGTLAYTRSANTTVSQYKGADDESDVAWMGRVLKDYPADFIWVIRRDNIDWKVINKEQLINRFPKAWFTTKVGIAACLQHMHWFSEAGVSDTFFPRCYRLCLEEERLAFQDDYRLTACMSYLRYFVDTFEKKGHASLADVHSKITPLSVDFASRQLGNYIRMRRHEDIDWLLPPNFMTQHWDAFIHQYYAVVHEKKRLRFDSPEAVHVKYEVAKKMLHKIAPYWPQIQLDGFYNMWICKPGARSRGKGIVIMNNLDKILDLLTQSNFRECNWVVQKYIERPMLIYKTKFDIRQWFLITDWTPLTIWFYKESYVRFCTKPFDLEDFHESIHLCNNAIQCRYQNSDQRDSNLPDENMWSSDTFQAYLKTIGRLDAWPLIYSGMKQAIVGVLLASQETVESRRGCYELYGADFMLTEDYRPWLIEINSCPCMAASTSVTARMCVQCLEDTIKVVVDRRHNKNADTGMFEMIYRQHTGSVTVQQFSGHDLTVVGKKLSRDIEWPMAISKSVTSTLMKSKTSLQAGLAKSKSENSNSNNKQTLSELLQKLRVRNQEMFQGTVTTQQSQIDSIFDSVSPTTVVSSGKGDITSLIEKMRSLKSVVPQDQEKLLGSPKRVYASPGIDPKIIENYQKSEKPPTASAEEKAPSSGKGPSSPKFMDLSTIGYLMKNIQSTSGQLGDETAQEVIVRNKKIDAVNKLLTEKQAPAPVPKTLAEVKAMVDSNYLGRPRDRQSAQEGDIDKQGNSANNAPNTYLSSILSQSHSDSSLEKAECDEPSSPIDNNINSSAFTNSEEEVTNPNDNSRVVDNPTDVIETWNSAPKDPITTEESSNDKFEDSGILPTLKKVSSLSSFGLEYPLRSWFSDKMCDEPVAPIETSRETSRGKVAKSVDKEINNNLTPPPRISSQLELSIGPAKKAAVVDECDENELESSNVEVSESSLNNGEIYRSMLLSSTSSQSSTASDSDSDFNNNVALLASTFVSIPIQTESSVIQIQESEARTELPSNHGESRKCTTSASSPAKNRPARYFQRRNSSYSRRCCSKRYPCYRVILEPQNYQQQRFVLNNKRKSGPTLPMKTVNLLLPSNHTYF